MLVAIFDIHRIKQSVGMCCGDLYLYSQISYRVVIWIAYSAFTVQQFTLCVEIKESLASQALAVSGQERCTWRQQTRVYPVTRCTENACNM